MITIIVLLILAGISITMLSGENSILKRATDAKKNTEDAQQLEENTLNEYANVMNTYTVGTSKVEETGAKEKLTGDELKAVTDNGMHEVTDIKNENLKNSANVKAVIQGEGTSEIPIPKDATYKEGTESTGIVIEYKGSEFVWVPVPVAIKSDSMPTGAKPMAKVATVTGYTSTIKTNYEGVLYKYSGSGENTTSSEYGSSEYGQGTTKYREPDIVTTYDSDSQNYLKNIGYVKDNKSDPDAFKEALIEDYRLMVESVAKYGGFYVGRYETSLDATTTVASKKSTVQSGTGAIMPMTAQTTSGNMWYGMYDKQKKFAGKNSDGTDNSDKMQSSMIWGSQYDAMLNWMLTGSNDAKTRVGASTYGNHGSSTVGCGTYNVSNVYDVINNIYDLEGNVYEWTLEAYSTIRRVSRGGYCGSAGSPSYRSVSYPDNTYDSGGSRLSLYIK